MKKIFFLSIVCILFASSCIQKSKEPEKVSSIENTLTSITFISDSTGTEPAAIFRSLDKVNQAIDTIGYPDAGYKLWLIQSDTSKNIKFMIQGSWPDQEVYNTIHKNELYLNAMKEWQKSASNLKEISYNRFILVK